jgi:hypothetical protein
LPNLDTLLTVLPVVVFASGRVVAVVVIGVGFAALQRRPVPLPLATFAEE